MRRVENITAAPYQRHTLLLDDQELTLELRFLPAVQIWIMNVEYLGRWQRGIKLSASVLHLRSFNFPFDFTVDLTDDSGIDPFRLDDFLNQRCELYFVTPEEMTELRGQEIRE